MNIFKAIFISIGVIGVIVSSVLGYITYNFWKADQCSYFSQGMSGQELQEAALYIVNNVTGPAQVLETLPKGLNMFDVQHVPHKDHRNILIEFPKCCPVFDEAISNNDKISNQFRVTKFPDALDDKQYINFLEAGSSGSDHQRGVVVLRYPALYVDDRQQEFYLMTHSSVDFNRCK